MPIRFRCTHCHGLMSISRRKAGTVVECLRCGATTQVPLEDEVEPASTQPRSVTPQLKPPAVPLPTKVAKPEPAQSLADAREHRRETPPPDFSSSRQNEARSHFADEPANGSSHPLPPVDEIFQEYEMDAPEERASTAEAALPSPPPIRPTNDPADAELEASLKEFDEQFDPITRDEHEDVLEQLHRSTSTMILPDKPNEDSYVPEEIFQDEDEARPVQFRRKSLNDDEMDLTPMVDVTFQLLIFFMVSASFSLQKSIEVPTPDPDSKGASQQVKTLDDLQGTSIVVKIDATNAIWLDDEPLSDSRRLADTLRDKMRREQKTELLINANSQSLHRTVIAVIDAANEIGVQKIRMSSSKKTD